MKLRCHTLFRQPSSNVIDLALDCFFILPLMLKSVVTTTGTRSDVPRIALLQCRVERSLRHCEKRENEGPTSWQMVARGKTENTLGDVIL